MSPWESSRVDRAMPQQCQQFYPKRSSFSGLSARFAPVISLSLDVLKDVLNGAQRLNVLNKASAITVSDLPFYNQGFAGPE